MENLTLSKKNDLSEADEKEDRLVSLRGQAKQTGVILGDGELWDGVERRVSRLLAISKKSLKKGQREDKEPSMFFG